MTREQLKAYMNEAIDALTEDDIDILFPSDKQPDLYTLVTELTSLKGEIKKMSQTNLKLNNEVHSLIENEKVIKENLIANTKKEVEEVPINPKLQELLIHLMDQDEIMQKTQENLTDLPELSFFSTNKFKTQFAAWKKGYEISMQKWNSSMNILGLKKTGIKNETFNPEYHEAIEVKKAPNFADNIIIDTEVMGYLFENQLIRAAKVIVNKK